MQDAARFKIDLPGRLAQVLQGNVKILITQCDMRHLYDATPKDEAVITQAKEWERRRCGHHTLDKPLSTLECLSSVVDPKDNLTNKHRYVIATQEPKVREHMRKIPGVPLVYINKSVMILEPMASAGEQQREALEKAKFKAGLKLGRGAQAGQKRKHDAIGGDNTGGHTNESIMGEAAGSLQREKKRPRGPKAPNPLSVKKPKKKEPPSIAFKPKTFTNPEDVPAEPSRDPTANAAETSTAADEESRKRKRRRKHKRRGDNDGVNGHSDGGVAISDND